MIIELNYDSKNKVTYFLTLEYRFEIVEKPLFLDGEGKEIALFHSEVYSNVYVVKTLKPQKIIRDPAGILSAEERKLKELFYDSTLPLVIKDLDLTDRKALIAFLNKYDLPDENKVGERDWYVGPWQNGRPVVALWRLEEFLERLRKVQKAVSLWCALMKDSILERDGSGVYDYSEERELVNGMSGERSGEELRKLAEHELVRRIGEELNRSPLPVRIRILPPGENMLSLKSLFRYELSPGDVFAYAWNVILEHLLLPPGKRLWSYKRCQKCGRWMEITKPHRTTRRYCEPCAKERLKEANRGRKRREREKKKTVGND